MGHPTGHRSAQGAGARARPLEPLPAADPRARRGADQPAVRAAGRDHRPQPVDGAGGAQLLGAGHREHGAALALRNARAEGPLAGSAARGHDPLGVLDDRAGCRVVGRHEHRDAHRARRRPLRHQRAQVVDVGGDVAALRAADRHGRHRPRRRAPPPPEHDPDPEGHAGRPRRALDEPLRLRRRPPRRPCRDRLRRRARPGVEPARRGGRGIPPGPGAARPRAHPPRHAHDRDGGAGARDDVPAHRRRDPRSGARSSSTASCSAGSPRRA